MVGRATLLLFAAIALRASAIDLPLSPNGTYWSEPPPPWIQPLQNEAMVVDAKGEIFIENSSGKSSLKTGDAVQLNSKLSTGAAGCVTLLLPGGSSIRLLPNSEGTVSQQMSGAKRITLVTMIKGVVFADVKPKPGEVQNFSVKTPYGIAKAKGTSFMVTSKDESMMVATITGEVEVTDGNGKFLGVSNPIAPKNPGIISTQITKSDLQSALAETLVSVQQFNSQTAALLEKQGRDPTSLTQDEKNFLSQTVAIPEALVQELNTALKQTTILSTTPTQTAPSLPVNLNPDLYIPATTPA